MCKRCLKEGFIVHILYGTTVLTLNSCTKGVGSLGIIHDRTPDCHPVSRAWMYG